MFDSEGIRQRRARTASYQNIARPNSINSAPQSADTVSGNSNNVASVPSEGQLPSVKDKKTAKWLLITGIILFVLLAAVAGFFAWKYFSSSEDTKDEVANKQTTAMVIEQVGKLFALPEGEEPTVAQIQDKDKLKDQEFFDRAQNSDYLLVYQEARIALLYRQSSNKLINVGPVSLDDKQQSQGQVSGEQTP